MVARLHEGYMRPERGLEGDRKSSRSYFAVKPRPGSRLKNERKRPQGSEMVVFVHAEVMKDGGYTFGDFTKYGSLVQAMGHAEMISFAHGLSLACVEVLHMVVCVSVVSLFVDIFKL